MKTALKVMRDSGSASVSLNESEIIRTLNEVKRRQTDKEASRLGFVVTRRKNDSLFMRENLVIRVRQSGSPTLDSNNAIHAMNEAMGAGYADSGYFSGDNTDGYIEYKIIPLNHTLEQKVPRKQHNDCSRIVHVGDYVSGVNMDNDKKCCGIIQKMKRDCDNDIISVMILDRNCGMLIELDPDSIALASPEPIQKINRRTLNLGNQGLIV